MNTLPNEQLAITLILAGLRHLQSDSLAGRDLSYLEDITGELLPEEKSEVIDYICESLNTEGLASPFTAEARYWELHDRATAWALYDKNKSAMPWPSCQRLDPAETIELMRLHKQCFGEEKRSDDPRHTPRCKVGDRVHIRNLGLTGKVIAEDLDADNHPHVPGEAVWFLRLSNGAEGGGWRDSELTPSAGGADHAK